MKMIIWTDGGSRSNPGKAAIGVVAKQNDETIHTFSEFLGIATNNEAEYLGFSKSLEWLLSHSNTNTKTNDISSIEWRLDSKLVVEQLNKRWKIKEPRLLQFAQHIWSGLNQLTVPYAIVHIPRKDNSEADALVNQCLDLQG